MKITVTRKHTIGDKTTEESTTAEFEDTDDPTHPTDTERSKLMERSRALHEFLAGIYPTDPPSDSDNSGLEFRRPTRELRDGKGRLVGGAHGDWQVKITTQEPPPYIAAVRMGGQLFIPCLSDYNEAQLDKEWNTGKPA